MLEYFNHHSSCINSELLESEFGFKYDVREANTNLMNSEAATSNCILFILQGEIILNKLTKFELRIKSNELVFLPSNLSHIIETSSKTEFVYLTFNGSSLSLCDKQQIENELSKIRIENDSDFPTLTIKPILRSYLELLAKMLKDGITCNHYHGLKFKEFFIILRHYYSSYEIASFFAPIVGSNVDFRTSVLDNSKNAKTREELARMTGHSISSFSRKFKKEFGESVYAWMQKQKDLEIMQRLAVSSISFTEIIDEFGFSSHAHFTKYCKDRLGVTPTTYRERIKVTDESICK